MTYSPLAALLIDKPRVRRVFFSFHYQQDIWRANQVRQSWRFGHETEREGVFRFRDASLWEKSKREPDESLKALIREGIKNTSVTCVLAGTHTYTRRWVRYEIARSIVKGNGLLTVKVHGLQDNHGRTNIEGPNPLDYMGVCGKENGNLHLVEKKEDGEWYWYGDYTQAVSLPPGWEQPGQYVITLSRFGSVHDYAAHNGQGNFSSWVSSAATGASR